MDYSKELLSPIVHGEIVLAEHELNEPYKVSLGVITHIQVILVKLVDKDGVVGWGEANPFKGFTSETHHEAINVLEQNLLPAVYALDNPNPWVVDAMIDDVYEGHRFGKAAIIMALLDIMGKKRSVPVATLLGGAVRNSLPVLWPFGDQSPEEDIDMINSKREEGYNTFMFKMGKPPVDIQASINRVLVVEKHFAGQDIKIICDPNAGWTHEQSIEFLEGIKGAKLILFVEQPVDKDAIDIMADLNSRTDFDFSADESLTNEPRAREIIDKKAATVFSVKSSKNGGPIRALRITQLAEQHGIKLWFNSMPEVGVSQAASLQHAMTIPEGSLIDAGHAYMSVLRLKGDATTFGSQVRDGVVYMSDAPGLGIEVDEKMLEAVSLMKVFVPRVRI